MATIYVVLGVLYESFAHPFTILTTLPSAGVGALLALWLAGLDVDIVAVIGIVLLIGIVKKNAIMMIDFAIVAEREHGLDPRAAIVEACRLRLRPIMMTTLAALFGAMPLAFAHGTGSELRIPLGITIIGGLLLSQLGHIPVLEEHAEIEVAGLKFTITEVDNLRIAKVLITELQNS